jgi:hypothetical protein
MPVLTHKELTQFDPKSRVHLSAYTQMRKMGRQTTIRFHLEKDFDNVVSMMNYKIIEQYLRDTA